tara:strand:+ start:154 stop:429 length:276 start_codon:yes stop_codon:yes gene_type:complete
LRITFIASPGNKRDEITFLISLRKINLYNLLKSKAEGDNEKLLANVRLSDMKIFSKISIKKYPTNIPIKKTINVLFFGKNIKTGVRNIVAV